MRFSGETVTMISENRKTTEKRRANGKTFCISYSTLGFNARKGKYSHSSKPSELPPSKLGASQDLFEHG